MRRRRLMSLVAVNLRASRTSAVFAIIGIAVGICLLTFFVGLGVGLRDRVLNRIFPADLVEFEPRAVTIFGVHDSVGQAPLDDLRVARLAALPGVVQAWGKQKSAFPAKLWGGRYLIGYDLRAEAFFDGVPPALLRAELRQTEDVPAKLARAAREPPDRCDVDMDCTPGARCLEGACERIIWAERFADEGLRLACGSTADCAPGGVCLQGRCVPACGADPDNPGASDGGPACAAPLTCQQPRCSQDEECPAGACQQGLCQVGGCLEACAPGGASCPMGMLCEAREGLTACRHQPCLLATADDADSLDPDAMRGHLARRCDQAGGWCATEARCPTPLYCAADLRGATLGACELPMPTVLNPLLLEVFNTDMAGALDIARMASPEALYGVRYHFALGDSFFTRDAPLGRQRVKQAVVVGFSTKAPELGVAAPLSVIRGFNARFKGRDAARAYDAVVVQTRGNEVVPDVVAAAERHGLGLSRRSRVARTFGTVVFLVWLALVLLALVVLAVAAINIAHTFAMLVHERRREIAILRALGATAVDIASLVVAEAMVLGLVGGAVGYGLSRLGALAIDAVAGRALQGIPLVPEAFFAFPWWSPLLAAGVAVSFCVLGSLAPARRAVKLDPATVLSQP